MSKDYYKVLDVEKGSTQDEIKKAFRKKAHKFHPDKQGGDEAKFKEANEAYQVLGDETKRSQYDQYGSTFDQQGGFGGGMNWQDFMSQARGGGGQNINVDLGDIFGDMFGFGRKKSRAGGHDIQTEIEIDFNEAAFGTKKTLELYKEMKCSKCNGNGAEPGTPIKKCETCNGNGHTVRVQQTILGAMQQKVACQTCKGQGSTIETKCSTCAGYGVEKDKVKIEVNIPAGIESGQALHMHGQGAAGELGAPAGDLYVTIRVKPSEDFARKGADVYSKVVIPYSQAVLGEKVEVKTIDGSGKLSVPAGTISGTVFKLKSKGAQKLRGHGRGDQYVEVEIAVPKNLNKQQKKLIKSMREENL